MKCSKITIIVTMLFCACSLSAQNTSNFFPFKGFHLGVTYQAELVQKCNMLPLVGNYEYPPVPLNTFGWELGVEISYHFAKYFGVSLGLNYGTVGTWNFQYRRAGGLHLYDIDKPYISEAMYDGPVGYGYPKFAELVFPLKLEFHFPLCRNLYFTSDIGIKFKGLHYRLYPPDYYATYSIGFDVQTAPPASDSIIYSEEYFEVFSRKDFKKIDIDFVIGAGLYYKLPCGDLLRLTTGVNLAFKDYTSGYYAYHFHDTYGTFSVRHNFLYAQFSYIHTFNYEKAKIRIKRNNMSFDSKKERRSYIYDLLK